MNGVRSDFSSSEASVSPEPDDVRPQASEPSLSFGLQVASILCWLVGAVSVIGVLSLPALTDVLSGSAFAVNLLAVLSVLTAGFVVRLRRRLAGYLVAGAWLVPNALTVVLGGSLPLGSLFLVFAIITVAANWRELR